MKHILKASPEYIQFLALKQLIYVGWYIFFAIGFQFIIPSWPILSGGGGIIIFFASKGIYASIRLYRCRHDCNYIIDTEGLGIVYGFDLSQPTYLYRWKKCSVNECHLAHWKSLPALQLHKRNGDFMFIVYSSTERYEAVSEFASILQQRLVLNTENIL